MEVEYQTLDPLRSNFSRTTHHCKPYKLLKDATFEFKVIYIRIIKTTTTNSSLSSSEMTLIFPPRDLRSCLQINGIKIQPNETSSIPLNKHREDSFLSESAFVNTDRIKFNGNSLPFQVQILLGNSGPCVSVTGVLRRNEQRKGDRCMSWMMECKEVNGGGAGVSVDVYFAGRSLGKPLLLNKVVEFKVLDCISEVDEDTISDTSSKEMSIQELEHKSIDEQLNNLLIEEDEEEILAEEGDLSWFNAGVRLGIGLGVGMSLGVGVSLGLILRTYKSTSSVVRKLMM